MGDLFHKDVPELFIHRVLAVAALCPQHTFQVLTKRADRMRELFRDSEYLQGEINSQARTFNKHEEIPEREWPLKNLWLGCTAENQAAADERIPLLLQTPAAVRFVSIEPMLGPVNLIWIGHDNEDWDGVVDALKGKTWIEQWDDNEGIKRHREDCQQINKLDWVICGGETGPGARPMHPEWVRSLRDQCQAAGVPFHFKQWGEWSPEPSDDCICHPWHDRYFWKVGRKAAGRLLDGREWNEFPEARQ
jgi:protein gp37